MANQLNLSGPQKTEFNRILDGVGNAINPETEKLYVIARWLHLYQPHNPGKLVRNQGYAVLVCRSRRGKSESTDSCQHVHPWRHH